MTKLIVRHIFVQRAESDFEVNVRAEKEITVILLHLEKQNELILKILHNIEKADNQPPRSKLSRYELNVIISQQAAEN
jgi:hypothetical protein